VHELPAVDRRELPDLLGALGNVDVQDRTDEVRVGARGPRFEPRGCDRGAGPNGADAPEPLTQRREVAIEARELVGGARRGGRSSKRINAQRSCIFA